MGGKGSGRKPKYNDDYHKITRQRQREYYSKNRKAWNLARKLGITMRESRRRLKTKRR